MLIFPTKYADVFLIRRYTLVINYLQEAVYRRKENTDWISYNQSF